jgi:hypothetical protein
LLGQSGRLILKANDKHSAKMWVDKICKACGFHKTLGNKVEQEKNSEPPETTISLEDFSHEPIHVKCQNKNLIAANVFDITESVCSYCFKISESSKNQIIPIATDTEPVYYSNLDELVGSIF